MKIMDFFFLQGHFFKVQERSLSREQKYRWHAGHAKTCSYFLGGFLDTFLAALGVIWLKTAAILKFGADLFKGKVREEWGAADL